MTMTTASLNGRAHTGGVTDDDIDPAAKPTRRTFSCTEYKAEILAEYDAHPKGSEARGAILRREGLYSSHISEWRKQAEAGARQGPGPPVLQAPLPRGGRAGEAPLAERAPGRRA